MASPIRLAGIAVWLSSLLHAQVASDNGTIEGLVADATGGGIPHASVTITNEATGLLQSKTSSDAGFYEFPLLPIGSYILVVRTPGFNRTQADHVRVAAGVPSIVNLQLRTGNVETTIMVSDAGNVIDPSRTDTGNSLTSREVANLPLVSRNPYNFVVLQPNVSGHPNPEFGVPRKINANGFDARINYQIDGNNNTESDRAGIRLTPYSDTFIAEIQTVSNGFAPEFGNTVGTVFNTVTKSGTNALHADTGYLFRRTDFSARPKLLSTVAPTPSTSVNTWFANVSGPVLKDKLFYFAGVEHINRDLPQVVTVPTSTLALLGLPANYANAIPFSQNVWFYQGKLDYQLNTANRLSVRVNGHRNDSPYNNGGGLTLVSETYNFIDRSYVAALQLISSIRPTVLNELRLQTPYRLQRQLPFSATGTGPSVVIPGVAQFGGSSGLNFFYKEVTPELADDVTVLLGAHTIKGGFGFRSIRDVQKQADSYIYQFPSVQAYVAAAHGLNPYGYLTFAESAMQPAVHYTSTFYNGFLQDEWKVSQKATLTYGLRYDVYQVPSANKNAAYPLSRKFTTDFNNFAPRVGIAISLDRTQRTTLRATGGIFYDPPPTDMYRRSLLQQGSVPTVNVVLQGPSFGSGLAPAFPAIPESIRLRQDVTTVAPDFSTLRSFNGNLTLSHRLGESGSLAISYFYTRGLNIPVYFQSNLQLIGQRLEDGRPIFNPLGYIDPHFANVLIARSVAQSSYNALNVTATHRFGNGLDLFTSYTWSHAIDDAPEQNTIDGGTTQLPSDPTNLRRDRGNSLIDRRHTFSASGVWEPHIEAAGPVLAAVLRHNIFSGIATAYSGDIFNIGSNAVLNGDPTITSALQRPLFLGRNTYTGPALYQLDLRYTRIVPISEHFRPEFLAEFTNLFNHDNIVGINTIARVDKTGLIIRPPSFGWTSALDQRLLQVGFRLTF